MCGLAGFCDSAKKSTKQTLIKMTDILHHRGPDDSGYSFYATDYASIGLGHRRLSILDLSNHGHQPMLFEHLKIVYNGEVYNFREIKEELEKENYTFNSDSDTEVILKAYHKWGIKAVDKFIGMFAIAIYDNKKNELTLIRDRAGVKPLYYYYKNGIFMFASELKSFHQNPYFKKELNIDSVGMFFQHGYILEPNSIFQNTFKLQAGHYLKFDIKNSIFKINKYWDVIDFYNKPKLNICFEEAKNEVYKLLKSACDYRMVADVPVGIFLSGGYDSSAVAAILQKDRSEKIKTFSIGFHEKKYNEAHYAKEIASHLGTEHTEYYCTQKDAKEILPLLADIWDEPFSDNSMIPTILVSKLAQQKVSVSLSADGGDEIFGGYDKYTQATKYFNTTSNIPFKGTWYSLLNMLSADNIPILNKTYNFKSRYEKIKMLLNAENILDVMNNLVSVFSQAEIDALLLENTNQQKTAFNDYNSISKKNNGLDKIMAIDYKTYQLDNILVKVDRATMSVSLEGREPLLDHRIIEYVAQLPSKYKIKDGEKKYILKSIVHDYIPIELMHRPKMGFSIPLKEWFGDELKVYVSKYLDSKKVKQTGIFNIEEVEKLKREWLENESINVNKIWYILIFMMWYERWM